MNFSSPLNINNELTPASDFMTIVADVADTPFLLTNDPLLASGVYEQKVKNRFGSVLVNRVRGFVYTDQSGTLYVEERSEDGTWTERKQVTVTLNTQADTGWVALTKKMYRFRYENNADAQGELYIYQAVGFGFSAGIFKEPFSGSETVTHVFSQTMRGLMIKNDGEESLSFTIDDGPSAGDTREILPYEGWNFNLEPFTTVTITTNVAFRAEGVS